MNKKIIVSVLIAIAGALLYGFFFRAGNAGDFISAYAAYDAASDVHAVAAYVPGGGNNPARQKLNGILPRVLTENLAPEERQRLSEEALVSVGEIRAEIEAIGREGEKADAALLKLREASEKVGGFSARRKAGSIVALAEERSKTITDIEEISSGINLQLEDIFRGIIADRGALTPERVSALNANLPEAEKQFDRLAEDYRKLDGIEKQMDATFSVLQS
jgi:hypothetical protein